MRFIITIFIIVISFNCYSQHSQSSWVIAKADSTTNLRNDQVMALWFPGTDSVLSLFNHFTGSQDGTACGIWAALSVDAGKTFGNPYELIPSISGQNNQSVSAELRCNGEVVVVWQKKAGSSWYIMRGISYDMGLTVPVSSYSVIFGPTSKKLSTAQDRIEVLPKGKWLFSTTERTIVNSENGYGKVFQSSDEGYTWSDIGINIIVADSSCQESGLVSHPNFDSTGWAVDYYWRSDRDFKKYYVRFTDTANFSSYSAQQFLGFYLQTASFTIRYDTLNDVFWCAKHWLYRMPHLTQTEVEDRIYIHLIASRHNYRNWQEVAMIASPNNDTIVNNGDDVHFNQPSLCQMGDDLFVLFNDGVPFHSGLYTANCLVRKIPIASILPMSDHIQTREIDIVATIPSWPKQAGGNGNVNNTRFLSIYFDKFPRWQAYLNFENEESAKFNYFRPTMRIRPFNTVGGFITYVDMSQIHFSTAFNMNVYSLNNIGTGINGNQPIERSMMLNGITLHEVYANARFKFFERIELARKTQTEINSFGQVTDGQMIYNLTTNELIIRKKGVWKNVLTN